MTPASLAGNAVVIGPDGEPLILETGSTIEFLEGGSGIAVIPPRDRVAFDRGGRRVPHEAAPLRIYLPDGTALVSTSCREIAE
jgi:hypothetical protein